MAPDDQAAPRSRIDDLVVEALGLLEDRGSGAVEELLERHPEHAGAGRELLARLGEVGLVESTVESALDSAPRRLGEFQLLERIGVGGMGAVYRAVQEPLGREVALKIIRPEQIFFRGARERFQREVETVARLQHPGIVQVHAVGEEDGVPYFVMELVRGRGLDAQLAGLAGRDPETLTGRDLDPSGEGRGYLFEGTWEEACLRVVRQVAEALAFAHANGVLHRDIKPSNVMLTTDGAARAMLLDFGLALERDGEALTRTGAQLGSLRYMAREQVRGERDQIGPRTDVYGLGLLLYELLSNQPAYAARSEAELVVAIERGDLPLVRKRNPSISWEAETICATATDPDPARRYGSAAEFARDLANALEHRPIEARRSGALLRARRWAQRRPAVATGALMGLAILVVGPAVVAWQEHRSGLVLAAERDGASRLADLTLEAMDRLLTRLGAEDLRYVPQMEPIREAALEDAVDLAERLLAERTGDPRMAESAADAQARLGRLLQELGRNEEADAAFVAGTELLGSLVEGRPDDRGLALKWRSQRAARAQALASLGRLKEAREQLEALDRELDADRQDAGLDASALRIQVQTVLGSTLDGLDDVDAAREALTRAVQASDAALDRHPGDAELLEVAVEAWSEFGLFLLTRFATDDSADDPGVTAALERAVEIAARARAADPEPPDLLREAMAINNLAGAYRRQGRYAEAGAAYERARGVLEPLVRDFPSTLLYKVHLATVRNQIGMNLEYEARAAEEAGDRERGEALFASTAPHYAETVRLLGELAAAAPQELRFQHHLAIARINLGNVRYKAEGDRPAWARLIEESVDAAERAHALAPDDGDVGRTLFDARVRLTNVHLGGGDHVAGAAVAADLPAALPDDNWRGHGRAAVTYALCAREAREDAALDEAERSRLVEEYARLACDHFRAAVERGAPGGDPTAMQDFEAIRGTAAYEALCRDYPSD